MDPEKIIAESITHEIDMDLLRELQKICKVNLEKEIQLDEKKFHGRLDRAVNNITNNSAHDTDSL